MNQKNPNIIKVAYIVHFVSSVIVRYFVLFLLVYVTLDKTLDFGDKGSSEGRFAYITAFVLLIPWIAIDLIRHKPLVTYRHPRLRLFIPSLAINLTLLLATGLYILLNGRIRIGDPLDQFILLVFAASLYSSVFKLYHWRKVLPATK